MQDLSSKLAQVVGNYHQARLEQDPSWKPSPGDKFLEAVDQVARDCPSKKDAEEEMNKLMEREEFYGYSALLKWNFPFGGNSA